MQANDRVTSRASLTLWSKLEIPSTAAVLSRLAFPTMGCGSSRAETALDATSSVKDLSKQVTRSRKRGEEPSETALKLLEGKNALSIALKVVPKDL